jgi:hypothetical protein
MERRNCTPLNELAKSVGLNLPSFLGSQADVAAAQAVPTIPETKLDVKIDSPRRS